MRLDPSRWIADARQVKGPILSAFTAALIALMGLRASAQESSKHLPRPTRLPPVQSGGAPYVTTRSSELAAGQIPRQLDNGPVAYVATLSPPRALSEADDADKPTEQKKKEQKKKSKPEPKSDQPLDWWNSEVTTPILDWEHWVTFDLDTALVDTLEHSPKIQSVSHRTSIAFEQIVQQDAVFDPTFLFETRGGRTNEPVGNTLTTGGPSRLAEPSMVSSAGILRTSRGGTTMDLSQEIGLLDSNSTFFAPSQQGNTRLSLGLTRPLYARGGRVYNERLLTQARIDGKITWQEMRGEVEQRLLEVITAYWRLYERRCHVMQQDRLIERALMIQKILEGRSQYDSSRVEIAKAAQRVARREDRRLQFNGDLRVQQARLVALIGSQRLACDDAALELIPTESPVFPEININFRDAVVTGIENRPEVRAAVADLESAALSVRVTRNELLPNLDAFVDAYLAALNGNYGIGQSFAGQFTETGPGFIAGIAYELPRGRRADRSRHREAHQRYMQRGEDLRETIQVTRLDIETALIDLRRASAQQTTKRKVLLTAIEEEKILTRRWEMMAGDGGNVGTVLENLLDAQQRTTDAQREWVTSQSDYLIAFAELQRAMGTLLIYEGIAPMRNRHCAGGSSIHFLNSSAIPSHEMIRMNQVDPELSTNPDDTSLPSDSTPPEELTAPMPSSLQPGGLVSEPDLIESIPTPPLSDEGNQP